MLKRANGMRYVRFLKNVLDKNIFDWYLEIGCRTGRIFGNSRGKTIAVDPYFMVDSNVITNKPELHIFQKTSDEFFSSKFLEVMDIKLSFTFLDGIHLFEFLLRDFIAAERYSTRNSIIALHDCCPFTFEMTTRDLGNLPKGNWTGDVWKLIPILQRYRPELKIVILDAAPTGLLIVSGLDPESNVLLDAYEDIVHEFFGIDLNIFGYEKFNNLIDFRDTFVFLENPNLLPTNIALCPEAVLTRHKVTP